MRADSIHVGNGHVYVGITASRRNLLALLTKLYTPGSARTLTAPGHTNGVSVSMALRSETDEEHYASRSTPPGPLAVSAQATLQVAADLIEQAADSLPSTEEGEFRRQALDKLATQVAYQRERLDHQVRIV